MILLNINFNLTGVLIVQRRQFLCVLPSITMAIIMRANGRETLGNDTVTIMKFSDDGKAQGLVTVEKINQSPAWKKELSSLAYEVTREGGTEYPFSQPGYDRHDQGLYRCVCCNNALFDSKTKYNSGTGWPSFWQSIAAQNVREHSDSSFGMSRTEVKCSLCDAHLGHVFHDGPKPTGLRYCMNTVALKFVSAS